MASNIGPNAPLPADGRIELSFDRLLLPSSVTRQAVVLTTAAGVPVPAPVVTYDPVARVVTLANPGPGEATWLEEDQFYLVALPSATGPREGGGLRAIDLAPLDKPSVIGFRATAPSPHRYAPTSSFCRDVLPLFQGACATRGCHTSREGLPSAGLVLDTATGIRDTALSRVAHGADRGVRANAPEVPGDHFGADMPIIDPYSPATSWLLYKLLLAPPSPSAGASATSCTGAGEPAKESPVDYTTHFFQDMGASERTCLSAFILGTEMPHPSARKEALTFEDIQRIRLWIAQGGHLPEPCAPCTR